MKIDSFSGIYTSFLYRASHPWRVSFCDTLIIVYKDGLEVRTNLNRYFLPYHKIKKITGKEVLFESRIDIFSNLPKVPNKISIHLPEAERVAEVVQKALEEHLNSGPYSKIKAEPGSESVESPTLIADKSSQEDLSSFNKKIKNEFDRKRAENTKRLLVRFIKVGLIVFSTELLILISFGPYTVQSKKMNGGSELTNIHDGSYEPYDGQDIPHDYAIVEVKKGIDGNIQSEKYYSWTGKKTTVIYKNNEVVSLSTSIIAGRIISGFFLLGFAVLLVSVLKEGIRPYAVTVIISTSIFAIVFVII